MTPTPTRTPMRPKAMAKKTPGVNVRTKKKNADVWSFAEGVLASAVAVALGSAVLRDARRAPQRAPRGASPRRAPWGSVLSDAATSLRRC